MNWVTEAPRRIYGHIEAATLELDGEVVPALAFAFESPDSEPITAIVVAYEADLRKLQREMDRAITEALRTVRKRQARSHL